MIDTEEGPTGHGKRRHKRGEQVERFKEQLLTWGSKGEVNLVSYRENVLQPLLYLFIDTLQQESGQPLIYPVEDNAPSHATAQAVDADILHENVIITFDWPPKPPDINKSEPIRNYEKDDIS